MTKLQDLDILSVGNTVQMAGAIYTGEGKTFLCFFPSEKDDLPKETLEMGLDDWTRFVKQLDLLETEVIERSSDGTLAKIIVRKSQRQIDTEIQWAVFKRDGYQCRYCGKDGPLTVDHLVTWEEGGPTIEDNLVAACRKCNKVRGRLPYPAWLYHPRYLKESKNLSEEVRAANLALKDTLDSIPLNKSKRSR